MHIRQFSQRMIELLPQCIRGFSRYEHNYLSRGEITMPQLWTLEYLSREEGSLMREIADCLGVSRPAATGIVDRLIVQGLATREDVPHDRREVRVIITNKGKKIVQNIWAQKRKALEGVFSKLSPGQRREYLIILEQVVAILSRQNKGSKKI